MDHATHNKVSTVIEHEVIDVIRKRKSVRAFSSEPVEQEKINSLFEAARWAPSSVNEQPWRYIYATRGDETLWNAILDALNESNRIWVKNAPLLIATYHTKTFSRNQAVNRYANYDLGAANAFIALQATALGLQVHQLGGYQPDQLRAALRLSDTFDLGAVLAVGYPGNPDKLPEHLKDREVAPRVRNRQPSFVNNPGI